MLANNEDNGNNRINNDKVEISTKVLKAKEKVLDYIDSSPPPPNLIDSSNVESNTGSIDSINNNADFVSF